MGDSELKFSEKIGRIKSKSSKKVVKVIDCLAKMEKLKAESLKKTEEMFGSAMHDLENLEQDIAKSRDLAPESKPRLNDDINATRAQIKQKYDEMRTRISAEISAGVLTGATGATESQTPKGDKGDTGATGATGATGPAS